jgi:hypothetical protein
MKLKQWMIRTLFLALVVGFLGLSAKPAAATTYSVRFTCTQAQNAVDFLLALDRQVEEELAEGSISEAAAAFYDQYIDNAIAYVKAHTDSTCSLGTDND